VACSELSGDQVGLLDALTASGLAASNGAGRKLVAGGGVSINGAPVVDPERTLDWQDALYARYYLLRRGKKNWHLLRRA